MEIELTRVERENDDTEEDLHEDDVKEDGKKGSLVSQGTTTD